VPDVVADESADDDLEYGDGYTVLELPEPDPAPGVEVLALTCPSGHANPPQRTTCRVCTVAVDGTPRRVARPGLGRLVTSTGESVELTGTVIVGRNPTAARFQGTDVPQLLPVPHPHVSANHLEIRLEGWSVLAVDLRSRNGTFLRRHGEPPVRLPEAPQLLVADDVLDLGHGIHLTFAELP
jgi:FHA domain